MAAEDTPPFGEHFEVRVTDNAIAVFRHGTNAMIWQIEWVAIEEIIAWKEDLFVVDRICMGFAWAGSDVLKVVDEAMIGWDELQAALEQRLGVKYADVWWREVALPPFAENRRVLWQRPGQGK